MTITKLRPTFTFDQDRLDALPRPRARSLCRRQDQPRSVA